MPPRNQHRGGQAEPCGGSGAAGQASGERAGRVGWLLRSGFNTARDVVTLDFRIRGLRNELLWQYARDKPLSWHGPWPVSSEDG